MDIEKLIEQLHIAGAGNPGNIFDVAATALQYLSEGADEVNAALQEQIAESEKLQTELERMKRCIEIVERQRDEAIYDMTALMAGQCCNLCTVEYCNDRGKTEMCTAFKWRVPQKED